MVVVEDCYINEDSFECFFLYNDDDLIKDEYLSLDCLVVSVMVRKKSLYLIRKSGRKRWLMIIGEEIEEKGGRGRKLNKL